MSTQPIPKRTAAEYLAFERESEERHELVNGEIRLMSGASRNHNRITANIGLMLGNSLKGVSDRHYLTDIRVKAADNYAYPGIAIVCDEPQFEHGEPDTLLNPSLLVEVFDQPNFYFVCSEKFACYRNSSSFIEYVLVSEDSPYVEHFTKLDDGAWRFNPTEGLDSEIRLVTVDVRLPLRDIYDKVAFETPEQDTAAQE